MPRFRFALQSLLEHRERIERERAAAATESRRALEAARAELARLHAELLQGAGHGSAAGIDAQQCLVEECQRRHESVRADFDLARRGRELLQKLRERRYAAFCSERERAEERELDEANARLQG